ncbi:hypothetical protein JZ751_009833 [Albula glossodonta]|uniref:Uncharacterized protein n=1 Tax=Albula glossodonta TaxID=121402 RepID=A0A8T2P9H2_9TELE|nr:hypothetical protein JZ751_009833 [Albula glossodonta]
MGYDEVVRATLRCQRTGNTTRPRRIKTWVRPLNDITATAMTHSGPATCPPMSVSQRVPQPLQCFRGTADVRDTAVTITAASTLPPLSKDSCMAVSSSSLNSENPYATIKDLPIPQPRPLESSYMEMKSPVQRERSYVEIRPPPPHPASTAVERCSLGSVTEQETQNHYDLPVNSHIPGHYDLPPVRRPPSPSPRRLPH